MKRFGGIREESESQATSIRAGAVSADRDVPLATQPLINHSRLPLQPKTQTAPCPRIGRGDAPPLAPLRQPQLLIRIVAAAKTDLVRAIAGQHALEHLHREERAEGQRS